MGDRYDMLRRSGQRPEFFSCTPEQEGAYLRRADVVVARRDEEARYFDSVTGRNSAIVIPHIEDPHFVDKRFDRLENVGMVASPNRINLASLRQFVEAVDRLCGEARRPFTVHVAGRVSDMVGKLPPEEAGVFRKPLVHLHGFVPDIGSFYRAMDVIVSPVTVGTGINVKTVQAMAFGMPLVTTKSGSKGIETAEPMHIHADVESLVRGLLALVKNPDDLNRLARVSRERYDAFHRAADESMRSMLRHKKLIGLGGD